MRKRPLLLATSVALALPAQAPPPASPIATGVLVVRGRCVDFDTGAPCSLCRVKLTGHQSTGYSMAWSRSDWADPPQLTTGPDGTFRFEVRLPASDEEVDRGRYHLHISHADHGLWFSHCAFVVAMAQGGVDYGDVRLPRGVRPRIRCEDKTGGRQPGVLLLLLPSPTSSNDAFVHAVGDGPHWWVERSAYARTDIDGYLHVDDPLPPGDYTLEVRQRKASGSPKKVTLPLEAPVVVVVEPLEAGNAIRGRLVDESGQPVEGASLSDGMDSPTNCTTLRDGTFTLVREKATGRPTAQLCLAQNQRFDGWISVGQPEWGQRDVEIVVPSRTLHTFVVRTETGTPVEDFNLYCLQTVQGVRTGVRLAGSFAAGRALTRLSPGTYDLLVVPRSDRFRSAGWHPVTVDPEHEEIEVRVADAATCYVEVRFADDHAPAEGVLVEVIEGSEPGPFEWVCPSTVIDNVTRRREALLIASARTDVHGRAMLRLAQPGAVHLRVSDGGVRTTVQAVDLADGKAVPSIAVERGATLLGSVGPVATLRALDPERAANERPSIYAYHSWYAPTLTIVYDNGKARREGIRLDQQGRFHCNGLPPGPVEVQLRCWEKFKESSHRLVAQPLVLGSWTLRVDAPQRVELQLPEGFGGGR